MRGGTGQVEVYRERDQAWHPASITAYLGPRGPGPHTHRYRLAFPVPPAPRAGERRRTEDVALPSVDVAVQPTASIQARLRTLPPWAGPPPALGRGARRRQPTRGGARIPAADDDDDSDDAVEEAGRAGPGRAEPGGGEVDDAPATCRRRVAERAGGQPAGPATGTEKAAADTADGGAAEERERTEAAREEATAAEEEEKEDKAAAAEEEEEEEEDDDETFIGDDGRPCGQVRVCVRACPACPPRRRVA